MVRHLGLLLLVSIGMVPSNLKVRFRFEAPDQFCLFLKNHSFTEGYVRNYELFLSVPNLHQKGFSATSTP